MYSTFTMIFFRVGYRLTPVTRYGIAYKSNSYCCSGYVSGPGSSCIRKFLYHKAINSCKNYYYNIQMG